LVTQNYTDDFKNLICITYSLSIFQSSLLYFSILTEIRVSAHSLLVGCYIFTT